MRITGSAMTGLTLPCETITACRRLAEEYGTTADLAEIFDAAGNLVGRHERSCDGDRRDWYEAEF